MYWCAEMRNFVIIHLIWVIYWETLDATCTFPTTWDGEWHDSAFETTEISLNNSGRSVESGWTITAYAQQVTSWTCQAEDTSNGFFVFQGNQQVTVPGLSFSTTAFRCIKWTKITDYSYLYYVYAPVEPNAGDERVFMQISSQSATIDTETYCNSTYMPGVEEFHMLVKVGREVDVQQMCSKPLLGVFTYTFNDGSNDHCGDDSGLDVCSIRTVMTFNYTACSEQQAYSSAGEVYCVYTLLTGSTYYTMVINPETVDYSNTFKFTCYAVQYNGTKVIVSDSKGSCEAGQTPSSKQSDGVGTLVMTASITDPTTSDSSPGTSGNYIPIIIACVVGVIVLFIIIIVSVIIFKRKCKKSKSKSLPDTNEANEKPRLENGVNDNVGNGINLPTIVDSPEQPNLENIMMTRSADVSSLPPIAIPESQSEINSSKNEVTNDKLKGIIDVSAKRVSTIDDPTTNRMGVKIIESWDGMFSGKQLSIDIPEDIPEEDDLESKESLHTSSNVLMPKQSYSRNLGGKQNKISHADSLVKIPKPNKPNSQISDKKQTGSKKMKKGKPKSTGQQRKSVGIGNLTKSGANVNKLTGSILTVDTKFDHRQSKTDIRLKHDILKSDVKESDSKVTNDNLALNATYTGNKSLQVSRDLNVKEDLLNQCKTEKINVRRPEAQSDNTYKNQSSNIDGNHSRTREGTVKVNTDINEAPKSVTMKNGDPNSFILVKSDSMISPDLGKVDEHTNNRLSNVVDDNGHFDLSVHSDMNSFISFPQDLIEGTNVGKPPAATSFVP